MTAAASLPPVLLLGVDTAIGLTVLRELGRHGVPVVAIGKGPHALGRHSRFAVAFHERPAGAPLADWLPGLIARSGAKLLMAISEGDLLELSALPPIIGACRVLTPRRDMLDIVLDKTRTLQIARELGIDVPESWQPEADQDLGARARSLHYPVVLKWADPPAIWALLSAHGIPFEKTEFAADADALIGILGRYERIGRFPLVQSWCRGEGFGQMLLMQDGAARLRFQHRRLREFPPSGGVSTLCESVPADRHEPQMARSEALLARIGWEGPAMVEYRHDPRSGRYWLMEVNGRFWGSLPLASQSGAHFAWELYRSAIEPESSPAPDGYRYRRARYLVPDTKRLMRLLRDPRAAAAPGEPPPGRAREILAYVAEFLDPRTRYYVWDWSDPKPLLADLLGIVGRRLARTDPDALATREAQRRKA